MAIPPSPFPNVFPSEEKERYITRNLFIWEVLHVYHKRRRALAAPWETCVLSWPRRVGGCTSRDTSRRLSVYNLTPTCVTWRFASSPECALIQTTTTKPKKPPSRSPPPPDSFQISFDCWRLMIFLTSPLDGALALERAIRCGIHDRVHSHAATTSSPFLLQTALSLSLVRV